MCCIMQEMRWNVLKYFISADSAAFYRFSAQSAQTLHSFSTFSGFPTKYPLTAADPSTRGQLVSELSGLSVSDGFTGDLTLFRLLRGIWSSFCLVRMFLLGYHHSLGLWIVLYQSGVKHRNTSVSRCRVFGSIWFRPPHPGFILFCNMILLVDTKNCEQIILEKPEKFFWGTIFFARKHKSADIFSANMINYNLRFPFFTKAK